MLEGNLPNSQLENDSITINGSEVALGGSTTIATGANNSPAFYADTNGNIDISSGSFSDVVFNNTRFDTDSGFDTSTGEYTIPTGKGGTYFFGVGLQWTSGTNKLHIRFGVNGSNPYSGYDGYADYGSVGELKYGYRSIIVPLTPADVVNIKTYHESGATRTLYTTRCNFFGYRLF